MVETITNINQSVEEVEQEHNEDIIITAPFDPNQDIVISTPPLNMGDIIDRLEHNEIKIDTEFQRLPDLWNATKKSRFIESILLKLPVPAFYFDAGDDNLWRIIDGLQRISTIKSFVIDKTLKLENLEFLKDYNNDYFDDLPRSLQRRIKTFPITGNILGRGTPDVVKYNIFNRINQGGLKLVPQEMRHALHQGKASDLVADLVRGEDLLDDNGELKKASTEEGVAFVRATDGKIRSQRMQDRDFANRFIAFYLIPYTEYAPDLDSFLSKGMAKINELSDGEIQQLKTNFKRAMNTAYAIFGNDAFRKRFDEYDDRKPVNKALFEVLSVNFAKLSREECELLYDRKETFQTAFIELHQYNDFVQSISSGTAQPERVTKRFEAINRIIQETLNQV